MTPSDLRTITNLIGRKRLANLLHIHPVHLGKKLSGKTGISGRDELAIRHVLDKLVREATASRGKVQP